MQDFRAYTTIKEPCEVLQVIKKSKFYGRLFPVQTPEEAQTIVDDCKKKYWDASHNCSAYVIGKMGELSRCSDDGEPGGTAGRPMLDVLLGEQIHNVCVVVTRYFGGTLLGTGGLVRAYSAAVKEGLRNSTIIHKIPGQELSVTCDYNGIGKLQYIVGQMKIHTLDTDYTDIVVSRLLMPEEETDTFIKKVTEATNGRAVIEPAGKPYYADKNGEIVLFEQ